MKGSVVAVLGLAYKPNIDDCRESPSFEIIKHLEEKGVEVRTFDPFVLNRSTHKSLDEALDGVDAVVIATAHSVFKALTPNDLLSRGICIVTDGRNCLDKKVFMDAGVTYRGIGK